MHHKIVKAHFKVTQLHRISLCWVAGKVMTYFVNAKPHRLYVIKEHTKARTVLLKPGFLTAFLRASLYPFTPPSNPRGPEGRVSCLPRTLSPGPGEKVLSQTSTNVLWGKTPLQLFEIFLSPFFYLKLSYYLGKINRKKK